MTSKQFRNMDTVLTRTSLSKRPGVIRTLHAELQRAERDEGLSLPELSFVINEKIEILDDWTSRWCTSWRTLCLLVPREDKQQPPGVDGATQMRFRASRLCFFHCQQQQPICHLVKNLLLAALGGCPVLSTHSTCVIQCEV